MAKSVDIKVLNEIVDKTIHAIESGKKEIFEISEKARDDCREIEDELIKLKKKILKIIEESDRLEKLEKESRKKKTFR